MLVSLQRIRTMCRSLMNSQYYVQFYGINCSIYKLHQSLLLPWLVTYRLSNARKENATFVFCKPILRQLTCIIISLRFCFICANSQFFPYTTVQILVIIVQCCYLTVVQSQGVPLDRFYRDDINPIFNESYLLNPNDGCGPVDSRLLPPVVPFIENIIDVPTDSTNTFRVTPSNCV